MKSTDDSIIVEQIYNASIDKVWRAITQQKEMVQWYFENIEIFIPELGFGTNFVVQSEKRKFTHR